MPLRGCRMHLRSRREMEKSDRKCIWAEFRNCSTGGEAFLGGH